MARFAARDVVRRFCTHPPTLCRRARDLKCVLVCCPTEHIRVSLRARVDRVRRDDVGSVGRPLGGRPADGATVRSMWACMSLPRRRSRQGPCGLTCACSHLARIIWTDLLRLSGLRVRRAVMRITPRESGLRATRLAIRDSGDRCVHAKAESGDLKTHSLARFAARDVVR